MAFVTPISQTLGTPHNHRWGKRAIIARPLSVAQEWIKTAE